MASQGKGVVAAIIIIIVLVVVGVVVYQFAFKKPTPSGEGEAPPSAETPLPPATGNVDEIAGDLLNEVSEESIKLDEETADNSFLDIGTQEVENFGQLYGENEF